MTIISTWILRIIIFIIIATMVDAFLPENKMKEYVYVVFGFILFLIFTQPLLYLFSIDIEKEINKVESIIEQSGSETNPASISYEMQKNEIEIEQRAYILEQAKSTLIKEANKKLEEEYQVTITDLHINFKEASEDEIDEYYVIISEIDDSRHSKIVPIIISTKTAPLREQQENHLNLIKYSISEVWGADKNLINVNWEEGK